MNFVNANKIDNGKYGVDSFSEDYSPMFSGVVKATVGDYSSWVGDMLFNNFGNNYVNTNRAYVAYYSDRDIQVQDYGDIKNTSGIALKDEYALTRILGDEYRYELSTIRNSKVSQDIAASDTVEYKDDYIIYDIVYPSGGIVIENVYTEYPGEPYYSLYIKGSVGELTKIRDSEFTVKSLELKSTLTYTGGAVGDEYVAVLFYNSDSQSNVSIDASVDPDGDCTAQNYPGDNLNGAHLAILTNNRYLDNQVYSYKCLDGTVNYNIGSQYPEVFDSGNIYKSAFKPGSAYLKVDNAQIIRNMELNDQSKITYKVPEGLINNSGEYGINLDPSSQGPSYNGAPIAIDSIDKYVETQRRHSAAITTEPYMSNKAINNGEIVEFRIVDVNGNDYSVGVEGLAGARAEIIALPSTTSVIANYTSTQDFNKDIMEVIEIDRSTAVLSTSTVNDFLDFKAPKRSGLSMIEKLSDGKIYTFKMLAKDITTTTVTSFFVRSLDDSTIIFNPFGSNVVVNVFDSNMERFIPISIKVESSQITVDFGKTMEDYLVNIVNTGSTGGYNATLSGTSGDIVHSLSSENITTQFKRSDGTVYYPGRVEVIDGNTINSDYEDGTNVSLFSEDAVKQYVETVNYSGVDIAVQHDLDSDAVVVQVYDKSDHRKIVPTKIKISNKNVVEVSFEHNGEYIVIISVGGEDCYGYSDCMAKIVGMSVNSVGNYMLYTTNYKPSQDGRDEKVVDLFLYRDILSRSNNEKFSPMVKIPGANGYIKIMSRNNSSTETVLPDGRVKTLWDVELPYANGAFKYYNSADASKFNKVTIKYNDTHIKAGSREIISGKIDANNYRVIPSAAVYSNITKCYNLDSERMLHNKSSFTNYPIDSVFYSVEDEAYSITTHKDDIRVSGVDGDGDYAIQLAASRKYWTTDDRVKLPYVGRENPAYEFDIDITTAVKKDGLNYKINSQLHSLKRWFSALFVGGGRTVETSSTQGTFGGDIIISIYNHNFKTWNIYTGDTVPADGMIRREIETNYDSTHIRYIDIIKDHDEFVKDGIVKVQCRIRNVSSGDYNWTGDVYDWSLADYTTKVKSITAHYFKLYSV